MAKVIADITMSLDGYVAPPATDSTDGVADVDELQTWVMDQDRVDTETLQRATAATGAVVMGRRLFDIVDAPGVWTKDEAGLVEVLHLHLAPMLLGGGTPLFRPGTRQRYRLRAVHPSSNAVHLIYERSVSAQHEAVHGPQAPTHVGTASPN